METRALEDIDLPPLPAGVGYGERGDFTRHRGGEPVRGRDNQPYPSEDFVNIEYSTCQFHRFRRDRLPMPLPPDHIAHTYFLLRDAVRERRSLMEVVGAIHAADGSTPLDTGLAAMTYGAVYGVRAIPTNWIENCWSDSYDGFGFTHADLVSGTIAEALLQTGYRWAMRWLTERGIDPATLEREEPIREDPFE